MYNTRTVRFSTNRLLNPQLFFGRSSRGLPLLFWCLSVLNGCHSPKGKTYPEASGNHDSIKIAPLGEREGRESCGGENCLGCKAPSPRDLLLKKEGSAATPTKSEVEVDKKGD